MRKKSKQIIEVTEQIAVDRLRRYINECDCDELARLIGDIFGGECYNEGRPEIYYFKPNENYAGEFNDLIEEKK